MVELQVVILWAVHEVSSAKEYFGTGSAFVAGPRNTPLNSVDKKKQLDVTFCILYFSSNSCSTCFGQPCVHHQELTTA